jgi:hypothetical protein
MGKVLFACTRNKKSLLHIGMRKEIEAVLTPDHLLPSEAQYFNEDGMELFVFNPGSEMNRQGVSVCLGRTDSDDWPHPNSPVDGGNFAMIRSDRSCVEVLTDVTASRSIYYYHDDEMFLASTSQRALLLCMKGFRVNQQAVSWMLVSGCLGPGHSWDERIHMVSCDSLIRLDKARWDVTETRKAISFHPQRQSRRDASRTLLGLLEQAVRSIPIERGKWMLPLSGGYDSRAILCLLHRQGRSNEVKTLTWGLPQSIHMPLNDAWVSSKLAAELGVQHEYLLTSDTNIPASVKLTRFLDCSEGRIDHISGYWDGMAIWNTLHSRGVHGVLRGDEGFGWSPVWTEQEVLESIGIMPITDDPLLSKWNCEPRVLPGEFHRGTGETLAGWRDRLYHSFRIPVVLAALSDIKLTYIELENPLLDKRIIDFVRTMKDSWRTEKRLYRDVVHQISPRIAIAKYDAIAAPTDILREREVQEYFSKRLMELPSHPAVSRRMIDDAQKWAERKGDSNASRKSRIRSLTRPFIPKFIKHIRKMTRLPRADRSVMVFRIWLIAEMVERFRADCHRKESLQSQAHPPVSS